MSCNLLKKKGLLIYFIWILAFVLNLNLVFAELNYTTGNSVYGILVDSENTNITGALNLTLQMQTCSLANCSDANWSAVYTNASYTSLISLANATYFQYKATFFTENQNYTPYLFNVTIDYTYLDVTYPLIDYGTGTAVDYANLSQNWIYVNVSVNETNLANITFSLYNNTATVNSTTFLTANYTINWTNLPVLNYTYQVNISDFAGYINATSLRHIWLDYTLPNATLLTPLNNTYFANGTSLNLTANISDVGEGVKNATLNVISNSGNRWLSFNGVNNYVKIGRTCPSNMSYINKFGGYCIDSYEASMPSANSTTIGNSTDVARIDAPGTMMATSKGGVVPWVSVSANSARTACTNAGKHLCTDEEWLGAVNVWGKVYYLPSDLASAPYYCNTNSACSGHSYAGGSACNTGSKTNCTSSEGVYDMVGNVWEWTNNTVDVTNPGSGANYYYINTTDLSWSLSSTADNGKYGKDYVYFPANSTGRAVIRGGRWDDAAEAGPFCAYLNSLPSSAVSSIGFRCCSS